jgi:hypothetical protein
MSKPPRAAAQEPLSRKKKWSKWLKFAGGALLLVAFGIQMNQNRQTALTAKSTEAAELEGCCIMRALEYQNLYLSSKIAGAPQTEYLQFAAQEYFHGRMGMMLASPGDRGDIGTKLKELKKAADNVHDEDSLKQYFATHNMLEIDSHKTELEGLVKPNQNAEKLGLFYMALYALGTAIALTGGALD